jgi:hypothetical protein
MSSPSIFDDTIDPNRQKVFKKSRGRPRTRALRSPNRCAPGVSEAMCLSAAYAPHCQYIYTRDKRDYCRKRTNKRRRP